MTQQETPLRLAEILSDLVSLQVCDPAAALALVSARANDPSPPTATTQDDDDDVDLKRAKDLLKYHYDVREKHKRGQLSVGLEQARRDVEKVVGTE
ncbi:hypothetical protein BDU57DRAFT_542263 [Ampelomyces quisqualis]|uniref:Uncharacterized protein n=1 Tax=Ampelomyces quisqualis TaxID=50730 RepID=A0A6A5QC64_AMPQU|nr:hypothetical protein BDU57DRAFT_542263 [Ampelomyces quisqualis]